MGIHTRADWAQEKHGHDQPIITRRTVCRKRRLWRQMTVTAWRGLTYNVCWERSLLYIELRFIHHEKTTWPINSSFTAYLRLYITVNVWEYQPCNPNRLAVRNIFVIWLVWYTVIAAGNRDFHHFIDFLFPTKKNFKANPFQATSKAASLRHRNRA